MAASEIVGVAVNAALMVLVSWAVMSDRVRDGLIIKTGLALIWLGAFAELQALLPSEDYSPVWVRATFMSGGVLVIFLVVLWSAHKPERKVIPQRRRTDPINLEDWRRVTGGVKHEDV